MQPRARSESSTIKYHLTKKLRMHGCGGWDSERIAGQQKGAGSRPSLSNARGLLLLVLVTYPPQNAGCYRVSSHCLVERSRAYYGRSRELILSISTAARPGRLQRPFFVAAVCIAGAISRSPTNVGFAPTAAPDFSNWCYRLFAELMWFYPEALSKLSTLLRYSEGG